jgi:16S rRNA (cytosine1407-C5)-methyltransferase
MGNWLMERSIVRILERYAGMLDEATRGQLVAAMMRSLPPAIRINTLKIGVSEAVRVWRQRYGWGMQQVAFCPSGWRLTENAENVSWMREHRMGFYYMQEVASMLPVEMFGFTDEEWPLVLDMAAAPGGKTTHVVTRLGDRGLVIANDSNSQRLPSLQGNLQRWGASSTVVTNHPGEHFGRWFPEVFDYVLLDAPCSGEALRAADRHQSRLVSTQERELLQHRQVKLLSSAFQALRPGGQLIYATCSLAPEEDEAVLDALLRCYPCQASVEAVDHLLSVPAPGCVFDGRHMYSGVVQRAVRLWPHLYDSAGFFAALIRKQDTVAVQSVTPPSRSFEKAGYKLLTQQERDEVVAKVQEIYGFDLGGVIERQRLVLWRHGHAVSAVPGRWLSRFAEFPFVTAGMMLGKQSRRGFEPSHELVARFSSGFTRRRVTIDEGQVEVWLAGRCLERRRVASHVAEGLVLVEDGEGRFLGRGKVDGDEIRNMLPRWV